MRGRIRAGLTYANVMATVAVFIALGGTGYAALPPGNPDAAGGAPAYAFVNSNATLGDTSRVKNFDRAGTNGGVPMPALYCLHTTVVPHNVVATVSPQLPGGFATVEFFEDVDGAHCPDRAEAFNIIVRTFNASDTLSARSFTVAVN
jgi:hypothetical protein